MFKNYRLPEFLFSNFAFGNKINLILVTISRTRILTKLYDTPIVPQTRCPVCTIPVTLPETL